MYFVTIAKNGRVIGELGAGRCKIRGMGTLYHHPSQAQTAIASFMRKYPVDNFECVMREKPNRKVVEVVRRTELESAAQIYDRVIKNALSTRGDIEVALNNLIDAALRHSQNRRRR